MSDSLVLCLEGESAVHIEGYFQAVVRSDGKLNNIKYWKTARDRIG